MSTTTPTPARDMTRARRLRQLLAEVPEPPAWASVLAEPLERLKVMTADHARARADVEALEAAHREAIAADRAAFGRAKREGKPAPPATAVDDAEAALKAARREAEACEEATALLVDEIARAVEANRGDLVAAAECDASDAREACAEILADLVDRHTRLTRARAWSGWLGSFPAGKAVFRAHPGRVDGLLQRSGEPFDVPSVLGALAGVYSGEPRAIPAPALVRVAAEDDAA